MVKTRPVRQVLSPDGSEVFGLWQAPEQVLPDVHAQVCLEWKGRLGYPTSYAMLGGKRASPETGSVKVRLGGRWRTSLAGPYEAVELGLPQEYHRALAVGLSPGGEVTIAAHGPVVLRRSRSSGWHREPT
jgi:hypothetical protein